MRIRKRSGTVLSSSSCDKAQPVNGLMGDGDQERRSHEQELLHPLVAAVIDVQAKVGGVSHGIGLGIDRRRGDKWRNALLGCSGSMAAKVDWEGETDECKWKGSVRRQGHNIGLLTKEGYKSQGAIPKEDTSSSGEEGIGGRDEQEWPDLPKSGGLEKTLSGSIKDHLVENVCTVNKRKRTKQDRSSRDDIHHELMNGWSRDEHKKAEEEKPKLADDKSTANYVGSQCRRRNGRGWRCSQRTLVGYSLCEHHLGKGRFKSINTNNGTLLLNNKGSKLKELRLLDCSGNQHDHDAADHKSKKRSLKLIS